jgi:hypothetical protein
MSLFFTKMETGRKTGSVWGVGSSGRGGGYKKKI